jgi:hypothetical protein
MLTRSGQLPYSGRNEFAVVTPERACIFDSNAVQFVCGDREWTDTIRFGRKGEGPGEIVAAGLLVSGPDGMLVHFASTNQRLTLFSAENDFLRTARLPFWLVPLGDLDADSVLAMAQITMTYKYGRIVWFSIPRDTIIEDREFQFDAGLVGKDAIYLSPPQITPAGEIVFKVGMDHLARFSREGKFLSLVEIPDFGTVYPSEREVEEWGYVRIKRATRAQMPPPTKEIEEFRRRPLERTSRAGWLQVDRSDRVWVAITRPSQVGTHLALFRRAEYLGNIEIPGRVLNFQIADSLLIALVEALEPDGDGLYPRRLDWYRIVER